MTAQVAEARSQVQRGVGQLEGARTRLQTILDTLTAGVIVFDREGRIDTVNPGATRILQRPLSAWRGRRLSSCPSCRTLRAASSSASSCWPPAPRPASATSGRIPSSSSAATAPR
jgi:nitrogen fixation/metabolism regulation signal transduction histidine kinase